tara:strand:+ start:336 stop:785 length:450 start_codon:yes stop_codon:yes gene_type:complete
MANKYWIANNPNSEVTDAEAQKIEELSATTVSLNELNSSCDASIIAPVKLLVSAAVPQNTRLIKLAHNSTPIEVTGPDGVRLGGQTMFITNVSASGTAAHTVTLASGTFDGTNNKATLNAPGESLHVWFDSSGEGAIINNVGSVALSSV